MATNKLPFINFAGGAWLYGKDVAVCGDSEVRELRAESCGGKIIPGSKQVVISVAEYEALRDEWTKGGELARGDARITQAALSYLGVNV